MCIPVSLLASFSWWFLASFQALIEEEIMHMFKQYEKLKP